MIERNANDIGSRLPIPDSPPIVFSDFDGTITRMDVTDEILTRLADPAWREIEDEWVRGRIGSRECLERQIALVETTEAALEELIDAIPLDPDFPAFVDFTRREAIPFYVLSDGFDYVIRRVLIRCGVSGQLRDGSHLFASSLRLQGHRLAVRFPHAPAPCEHGCATCKPAVMRAVAKDRRPIVYIGDGLSDRFAVEISDLVFAKGPLLDYCRERKIACQVFETFADVQSTLTNMVEARQLKIERSRRERVESFSF